MRDCPSKAANTIGEIDFCDVTSGTGRTQVEPHGLMYAELATCARYPRGGWVPVKKHDGHAVMQEQIEGTHDTYLKYRCMFVHGAHIRDTPSRNAHLIGEIDQGDVTALTGRVDTEEGNGVTYVELAYSGKYPIGGWVPLISQGGHVVMEACAAPVAQRQQQQQASNARTMSPSGSAYMVPIPPPQGVAPVSFNASRHLASPCAQEQGQDDWTVDAEGLLVPALLSRRSPLTETRTESPAVARNH